MKVTMAPTNFAGQPLTLVSELKKRKFPVELITYSPSKSDQFNFSDDHVVDKQIYLKGKNRLFEQFKCLKQCIEEGTTIFHFWFRTLIYGGGFKPILALDLPLIKSRNIKVAYRFTGSDLRIESIDKNENKYSAFHYGYTTPFKEQEQIAYINYLKEYVDMFILQDPEMLQFLPEATIVPRAINLDRWKFEGITKTNTPLVIHAPTHNGLKGSDFVLKAVDELQAKGLKFTFKMIQNMPLNEALEWYKKCDIAIDQLHIGAYGIFAMECMALGKPVLVYCREDLFNPIYGELPIINTNPDLIKTSLESAIKDYEMRKEIGEKARRFIKKHHDVKKIAPILISKYNEIETNDTAIPSGYDIDYLFNQLDTYLRENRKVGRHQMLKIFEDRKSAESGYKMMPKNKHDSEKDILNPIPVSVISKSLRQTFQKIKYKINILRKK